MSLNLGIRKPPSASDNWLSEISETHNFLDYPAPVESSEDRDFRGAAIRSAVCVSRNVEFIFQASNSATIEGERKMSDNENPDKKKIDSNIKRSSLAELRSLTDDLRDMTVASDEAAREARDRRQEIERALRNRRFWVPEQ